MEAQIASISDVMGENRQLQLILSYAIIL